MSSSERQKVINCIVHEKQLQNFVELPTAKMIEVTTPNALDGLLITRDFSSPK